MFCLCLALSQVPSLLPQTQHTGPCTPEVRVIHAGLVIGHRDEGCGWASVLDELVQNLLVVDGEAVHVLWRESGRVGIFAFFPGSPELPPPAKPAPASAPNPEPQLWLGVETRGQPCLGFGSTHWSRSSCRCPPSP